jgi:hypothetical protein
MNSYTNNAVQRPLIFGTLEGYKGNARRPVSSF